MSDTAAPAAPAATPLLPPLYSALEPLTAQRHADLRLHDAGYAFAARISAIPLVTEEFSIASRHYPIVFTAQTPHMPMVIMSLLADTNPQVDANGAWQPGKYIPAYLRRFPFFLVRVAEGSDELALCVDTTAPQISTTEGEMMFGADGKPTQILDQAFAFSRSLEAAMQKTRALTDLLTSLNLLQPTAVQFEQNGKPTKIDGFHAVQREAFAALPAEKLAELRDNGALELIYAHLASMGGLPELTASLAAAPPAPAL
jgi:SapC